MNKGVKRVLLFASIMALVGTGVFAQEFTDDVTTELVIEDFETTGLGDNTAFGISIGGLFEGSAALDLHFDFFVNPLIALRVGVNTFVTIPNPNAIDVAFDAGFGAIWRSYVVNRIRFYGGLMLRLGLSPLNTGEGAEADMDLLLIPEGFGGFEFYASPDVSIFAEFGGRTAVPIVSLNDGDPKEVYDYADGFFFRLGTRFGLKE